MQVRFLSSAFPEPWEDMMRIAALSLFAAGAALASQPTHTTEELRLDRSSIDRIEEALPTVTVDRDDFEIDRSCIVRIPVGLV
ncbi:MAG: hypothetical protein NXI07_08260, partial [bacterium]|nr:hypothetical protein [bacterium]